MSGLKRSNAFLEEDYEEERKKIRKLEQEACRDLAKQVEAQCYRQADQKLQDCAFCRCAETPEERQQKGKCGLYALVFTCCPVHEPELQEKMRALRIEFQNYRSGDMKGPARDPPP